MRVAALRAIVAYAAFAAVDQHVEAAYFHVKEGEEKCFLETVPEHQVLTVSYRHIENPGVPCMLIFKDTRNTQVFSKHIGAEDVTSGKTAYMTQRKGSHRVCVSCRGSKWFSQAALKWELSIEKGDTEFAWNPATRGGMRDVEKFVASTLSRADSISAENDYEKSSEIDFRNASESVSSHIVTIALFIVAMEAIVCAWQIWHLRGFFKREKLF